MKFTQACKYLLYSIADVVIKTCSKLLSLTVWGDSLAILKQEVLMNLQVDLLLIETGDLDIMRWKVCKIR